MSRQDPDLPLFEYISGFNLFRVSTTLLTAPSTIRGTGWCAWFAETRAPGSTTVSSPATGAQASSSGPSGDGSSIGNKFMLIISRDVPDIQPYLISGII